MRAPGWRSFLKGWLWSGALFLAGTGLAADGREEGAGPLAGKPAPAFHVQGIFQEQYSLEPFKGHILVMQFGTSW